MSELRDLTKLALPLAAQQLGFQLMGTVDALVLSRYDDTALAASGTGNNLLFVVTAIGIGIVIGMDSVVPQAIGGARHADARRLVNAGLRLAILVGLAATLLVLATPYVLDLADVERDVASQARLYVDLRAIGIAPLLVSVALRSFLAAHARTRPLVVAVVLGNIANLGLDLALVFGVPALHVPAMGVAGAAIATSGVQVLQLAIYFRALRLIDRAPGAPASAKSTSADLRAILHYGLPVGGQLFAEVAIFGVATVLAARLGKVPAAAHAIALNVSSFTFAVALGVGSATSVRVGHAVGANDLAAARRRGLAGITVGAAAMACFGVTFIALGEQLSSMFTADTVVIAAAVPLFHIAALFQMFDGIQAVGAGALRGLGDTRATLWANLAGHYLVGLPIMLGVGFGLGYGVVGLWWGLSGGLVVTAIVLVLRFVARAR
jgi:MATE family multidrug resistance protein